VLDLHPATGQALAADVRFVQQLLWQERYLQQDEHADSRESITSPMRCTVFLQAMVIFHNHDALL
jgi:hypothetical protein